MNYKIDQEHILAKIVLKHYKDNYDKNIIINNLRLQKTLYFVYGLYYGITGKLLYPDSKFYKWNLGPVNTKLYYDIKDICWGDGYANIDYDLYTNWIKTKYNTNSSCWIDEINNDVLVDILDFLSNYETFDLVKKSHKTDPWVFAADSEMISNEQVQSYFASFNKETFSYI